VTWLEPYPDELLDPQARYVARETVELAFVAALQRLPPRQTAALVLRDVLGFSATEVAGMLDTTETAVKGALQRARASLAGARDRPPPPPPGSAGERELIRRFAEAFTADDVDGVVALLTDDAWLTMPPAPHEYQGAAAIASFLRANAAWRDGRGVRLVATRANTQPAFGAYIVRPGDHVRRGIGLFAVTLAGERIVAITHFLDNALLARFGLPRRLD
jgi:RNA polymerase sigma-70 factor (TIGR02960 family)